MLALINRLRRDFPEIHFVAGERLRWSSESATITYGEKDSNDETAYGILHELGHALLKHERYTSDAELLQQEAAAWEHAHKLAANYGIEISEVYVDDCLDSYRDWLHTRSACPSCGVHGLERERSTYSCVNCGTEWRVGNNRFCRTYRIGMPIK